jgi:undecaprenyl-diphosphatase
MRIAAAGDRQHDRHPHHDPPVTPIGLLLHHPAIIGGLAAASVALALLAAVDGGSVLLGIDEPIATWAQQNRSEGLDLVFRVFSRLGSNVLVFAAAAALTLLAARRCPSLALTLGLAVAARPPLEYVLKDAIGRARPDFDRLVPGTGFSHPSGHVLAAIALWGLLPPLVALLTHRRWLWWASVATGLLLVLGVSASRVYLGVHWPTDLLQGWLLGSLYLVGLEALFSWHHRHRTCRIGVDALAMPSPPGANDGDPVEGSAGER